MKLKKVLAILMTTATVMSMTVGNVSFAAGTDMPTAVQQGGEESKKTEALNEQEETSQEVQESTERGGKEEDSKNESEEVARKRTLPGKMRQRYRLRNQKKRKESPYRQPKRSI